MAALKLAVHKPELRRLRDEGASNQEIASTFGCSERTVAHILGPMTSEERSRIMRNRSRSDRGCRNVLSINNEKVREQGKPVFPIFALSFSMIGSGGRKLKVDADKGVLEIEGENFTGSLNLEDVGQFVEDIQTAMRTAHSVSEAVKHTTVYFGK